MKKRFSRIISALIATTVIATSALTLFACNKKKKEYTLDDIFKSNTSFGEFTGYEQEFTLPVGWEVYTPTQTNKLGSDTGYITQLNAFVIVKYLDPSASTKTVSALSLIKCGDSRKYFEGADAVAGMVFPGDLGIIALRTKGNLIVCKFSNGDVGAFDINGDTAISRSKIKISDSQSTIESTSLDNVIKILDDRLIAVHTSFDGGPDKYTSIYRPTYSGGLGTRGELVCRVSNNDNALAYVNGFDGKYVSVVGNKASDGVYLIPDHADGSAKAISSSANGTLASEGQENYDKEITYIGDGRFFFNEMWTVSKAEDARYVLSDKNWTFSRHIYTPDDDKLTEYTKNSDKVFCNLSNSYYDSTKNGVNTSDYLNDGFIYASFGLFIEGKIPFYDQYILDKNLDVVMSLTGNFGVTVKDQTKDKVGVYDLIMTKTDGYYYIPLAPSEVRIYDGGGKLVGQNDRTTVLQQELSNNVIVAGITDPEDEDEVLFGAFNVKGEEIIPFEYTAISAFRGSYSVGEKYNDKNNKVVVLLGEDGAEISELSDGRAPFHDIATSSGKPIYKIGCYAYKVTEGTNDYFGIKSFNPNTDKNVIIPATMKLLTLYAPSSSPSDVFVFEKIESGNNFAYRVYRLV